MTSQGRRKLLLCIAIVGSLVAAYWFAMESRLLTELFNGTTLRDRLTELGVWGPFVIIGLMAVAILVSPLPSAPIAVASGAAFGHYWGTAYVLIGAELGALAAFSLARFLGYEFLHQWFGDKLSLGWLGSQNSLMSLVFVSRLLPFVSFDLISYAAGLTVLSFWRFAIATAVGIIPASFLLAHFGEELATGEAEKIMISIGALGAITLVPILYKVARGKFQKNNLDI